MLVFNAFILSHLNYMWGSVCAEKFKPVNKLFKCCARIMLKENFKSQSISFEMLTKLKILFAKDMYEKSLLMNIYSIINFPKYVCQNVC